MIPLSESFIRNEIRAVQDGLLEAGLGVQITPVVTEIDRGMSVLTYPAGPQGRKGYDSVSLSSYQQVVADRQFTALLRDGAVLQCSVGVHSGSVRWARLCFIPCPVLIDEAQLGEFGVLDQVDELVSNRDKGAVRLRGAIRIDFDPASAGANHPACHCTALGPECRIPVVAPIGVTHFARFILMHVYPTVSVTLTKAAKHAWSRVPVGSTAPEEIFVDWRP